MSAGKVLRLTWESRRKVDLPRDFLIDVSQSSCPAGRVACVSGTAEVFWCELAASVWSYLGPSLPSILACLGGAKAILLNPTKPVLLLVPVRHCSCEYGLSSASELRTKQSKGGTR